MVNIYLFNPLFGLGGAFKELTELGLPILNCDRVPKESPYLDLQVLKEPLTSG
jgi:hypothetical protein